MFEVELRGLLTEEAYRRLTTQLTSKPSQNDDKTSVFFSYPKGILKVVERAIDGHVKISLKLGDETTNSLHEHEVSLSPGTIHDAVSILEHIGYKVKSRIKQIRTNYKLDDEMEIAVKHTPSWGYHFEIEKLVEYEEDIEPTKLQLEAVLADLNLKAMSQVELKDFLRKLEDQNETND